MKRVKTIIFNSISTDSWEIACPFCHHIEAGMHYTDGFFTHSYVYCPRCGRQATIDTKHPWKRIGGVVDLHSYAADTGDRKNIDMMCITTFLSTVSAITDWTIYEMVCLDNYELIEACINNDVAKTKQFIEAMGPHIASGDNMALKTASAYGSVDVVRLLVTLDSVKKNALPSLHIAQECGQNAVARILMSVYDTSVYDMSFIADAQSHESCPKLHSDEE